MVHSHTCAFVDSHPYASCAIWAVVLAVLYCLLAMHASIYGHTPGVQIERMGSWLRRRSASW